MIGVTIPTQDIACIQYDIHLLISFVREIRRTFQCHPTHVCVRPFRLMLMPLFNHCFCLQRKCRLIVIRFVQQ